jgi:hypothetical protein
LSIFERLGSIDKRRHSMSPRVFAALAVLWILAALCLLAVAALSPT